MTLTSELVFAEIKIFQLRQFDDAWGDRTYTKPSQKQHHKRDGGLVHHHAESEKIHSTQTSQRAVAENQFFNISQLSHVQRQGESDVVGQTDLDTCGFHLDDGKRKLPCTN